MLDCISYGVLSSSFEGVRCNATRCDGQERCTGKAYMISDSRLYFSRMERMHPSISRLQHYLEVSRVCDDEYTAFKTPMHRALPAPVLTTTKMAKPKALDSRICNEMRP